MCQSDSDSPLPKNNIKNRDLILKKMEFFNYHILLVIITGLTLMAEE